MSAGDDYEMDRRARGTHRRGQDLPELQHHRGTAYRITFEAGQFCARRRDTGAVARCGTADDCGTVRRCRGGCQAAGREVVMEHADVFTSAANARSTVAMPVASASAETSLQMMFAWLAGNSSAQLSDQGWFWTREWQEGEREVDEAIAAGRTTYFGSVDEFLAALDPHTP